MKKGISGMHGGVVPIMDSSLFLCAAAVLGGIAGCMLVTNGEESSSAQLTSFLTNYMVRAVDSNLDIPYFDLFLQWGQRLGFAFLIECSAFRVLGLPVFLFLQGCIISYAVSCFIAVFGFPGLVVALVLFGIPTLCFFSGLFCMRWQTVNRFNLKEPYETWVWTSIGICLLLLAVIVLSECFLVVKLLPKAARFAVLFHIV